MTGAIASISVDAPNETAGLGQRAMEKAFTDQFIGQKLPLEYGNGVDALSGSTFTSNAVLQALNSITVNHQWNEVKGEVLEKVKEVYYQKAKALDSEGKYEEANRVFEQIKGYKDVADILAGEKYKVQDYSATVVTQFSTITVSVKVRSKDIIDCSIESSDVDGRLDLLTDEMKAEWAKAIVNNDTAETDVITGATLKFSAGAVQEAMNDILAQMGK